MPTNYNGDPTGLAATDTVTISDPNDGEANSAASNAAAPKKLADYAKFILNAAGFLGVARTWTAIQTFGVGLLSRAVDANPLLDGDEDPVGSFKLIARFGALGRKTRVYIGSGHEVLITVNAFWTNGSALWARDTGATSYRIILDAAGTLALQSQSAATWAEAAWVYSATALAADAISATSAAFGSLTAASAGFATSVTAATAIIDAIHANSGSVVALANALNLTVADPAANAAVLHKLYGRNLPKVLGTAPYGSGLAVDTPTAPGSYVFGVAGGFNFATFERKLVGGTDHYMKITFAQALADADYEWFAFDEPGSTAEPAALYYAKSKTASTLELYGVCPIIGGATVAKSLATAVGGSISFGVFGKQ